MKAITKPYIDGTFVESRGREVMDIINPTNGQVIARRLRHGHVFDQGRHAWKGG